MTLDDLVKIVPKPILVLSLLVLSLMIFVYSDPLRDECEIQTSVFQKKTLGVLSAVKKHGKIQFPLINYWKDRCKQGNSIGSCEDYLEGLRGLTKELHEVNEKCQISYNAQNEGFGVQVSQALQIMALVAWGEAPPAGVSERLGWLTEANVRTFCYLKKTFILLTDEDSFFALREKVYREFPDRWPENLDLERRLAENRPRAFKTSSNPNGKMIKEMIFERSLFSIKCDLYM